MQFRFQNLAPLCRSIRHNRKSIEQFEIIYNHVKFDCILDLDSTPFELMIGALNCNFACILHLLPGYIVELDELDYRELCAILNLNYSANHFTSFSFLKYIDDHLPHQASSQFVDPKHVARFRKNKLSTLEREEGFIFCGWLRHDGMNNGHARNTHKTEVLLGKSVADFCRKHDISSKWTTDITKMAPLTFPGGWKS